MYVWGSAALSAYHGDALKQSKHNRYNPMKGLFNVKKSLDAEEVHTAGQASIRATWVDEIAWRWSTALATTPSETLGHGTTRSTTVLIG